MERSYGFPSNSKTNVFSDLGDKKIFVKEYSLKESIASLHHLIRGHRELLDGRLSGQIVTTGGQGPGIVLILGNGKYRGKTVLIGVDFSIKTR